MIREIKINEIVLDHPLIWMKMPFWFIVPAFSQKVYFVDREILYQAFWRDATHSTLEDMEVIIYADHSLHNLYITLNFQDFIRKFPKIIKWGDVY